MVLRETAGRVAQEEREQLIAVAAMSVGETLASQLDWLVDFARSEEPPTKADVLAVDYFCFKRSLSGVGRKWRLPLGKRFSTGLKVEQAPALRSRLKRTLDDLRMFGSCLFPGYADGRTLAWDGSGMSVIFHGSSAAEIAFLDGVLTLLLEIGQKLRVCDAPLAGGTCGRLFVQNRPQQKRCSTACTNRAGQATHRARHPERVAERRHRRHERAVRSKPGKERVKVARRPPKKG